MTLSLPMKNVPFEIPFDSIRIERIGQNNFVVNIYVKGESAAQFTAEMPTGMRFDLELAGVLKGKLSMNGRQYI